MRVPLRAAGRLLASWRRQATRAGDRSMRPTRACSPIRPGRSVTWQLAIAAPDRRAHARQPAHRGAARRPSEMQVYKGASWAKPPTDMIEDAVLRALEDSGRIPAVARQGSGIERRLQADDWTCAASNPTTPATRRRRRRSRSTPSCCMRATRRSSPSRTFLQAARRAAPSTAVPAWSQRLRARRWRTTRAAQVAGWTLATGDANPRSAGRRRRA